jgi:hydroxyacylglutathione hydrolase
LKKIITIYILLFISSNLFSQSNLIVKSQKSGPVQVNSYLIFDTVNKNALIIDPGSNMDSLIEIINSNRLVLRYIFLTHAHQDHIAGLKDLKDRFNNAKIGFALQEYNDCIHYRNWRNIFSKDDVDFWQKDSLMCQLMDIDYNSINKPDIFLDENQVFYLGDYKVSVLHTPGHSRGSLTFAIGDCIFTGDLILYNTTGHLDYFLCSDNDMFESIQKLYKIFPEETIIYPGHGEPSSIGVERISNKKVKLLNHN